MKHRRRLQSQPLRAASEPQNPEPLTQGTLDLGPGSPPAHEWRLHDFRRPRALKDKELRILDALHSRFAENLAATLSALTRTRVQVRLASATQRPYFEFIRSLPSPTSLHLVYSYPHQVPLVLEMGLGVLFSMVERVLGGKGDGPALVRRPPTRIEQSVADTIARKVVAVLAETWAQGPGFRLDLAESEHNPLLVQIVGPSDPTLVLAFEVSMALRADSFHLALPLAPFQALISKLLCAGTPGSSLERGGLGGREQTLEQLSSSPVSLRAEFPSVPIALKDLLSLRPGDIIDTQIPRGSEAYVAVEGRRLFRGLVGSRDGRRVLRITRLDAAPPPPAERPSG